MKKLVIGASTGFGLASRISSAFGSDAATIGVKYGKNNFWLVQILLLWKKSGLYAKSVTWRCLF
jgi:trans-2-enoyl-CoA reductase